MYRLRSRKAGASQPPPAGRIPITPARSLYPGFEEHSSIAFLETVMSLNYRPKIDLRLLQKSGREYIGQGGSFRVEKSHIEGVDGQHPQAVVIKRPLLSPEHASQKAQWRNIRLEVEALLHPPISACQNIIDILAIGWEPETGDGIHPILVMPYASFGTLAAYVLEYNPDNPSRIALSYDVAKALDVLHKCGIVHGDLKSENILVFFEDLRPKAKLNDFGCSVTQPQSYGKLAAATQPWNCPEWRDVIAKELLPQTDVYSFGLLFWRTLSKTTNPFRDLGSFNKSQEPTDSMVENLKSLIDDRFLKEVKESLQVGEWTPEEFKLLETTLEHSIRREPNRRDLNACLTSLQSLLGHAALESLNQNPYVKPYLFEQHSKLDVEAASRLPWSMQESVFMHHSEVLKACQNSSDTAQSISASMWLFLCYLHGIGVNTDNYLACHHLLTAARLGDPIAESLSYRAITVLQSPSSPSSSPLADFVTTGQWLGRSLELGFFGAKEDFAHLISSNSKQSDRILGWFSIALSRLCCYTAGVGKGFFLDPSGNHLNPLSINNFEEFKKMILATNRKSEFDVNSFVVNSRGDRLLHLAATCGMEDATAFLISQFGRSIDINVTNDDGETPLLSASRSGQVITARTLLINGADLRPSNIGESPLHWLGAFRVNFAELASLMMKSVENAGGSEEKARVAHLHQKASGVAYSQYWGSELPAGTPLHRAVHFKIPVVVKTLLQLGADPCEPGIGDNPESALQLACGRHYTTILEVLLDQKNLADADSVLRIPLLHLSLSRHNEFSSLIHSGVRSLNSDDLDSTVATLISRNANPGLVHYKEEGKEMRTTALFQAVQSGSLRCVKLALSKQLLQSNALLNTPCGWPLATPLGIAVQNGSIELVRALLTANADPTNPVGDDGVSAEMSTLHSCALAEMWVKPGTVLDIFDLLVPAFPNVDIQPNHPSSNTEVFETPFILAARVGRFDLANALLEHGADLDFMFTTLVEQSDGEEDFRLHVHSELSAYSNKGNGSDLCITLLGAVLSYPSKASNSVSRFLLGYDDRGRKRKDWRHKLPDPVVSKDMNWTVWHAVAFRRKQTPVYDVEHIRELTRLLSENYKGLGREFLNKRCGIQTVGDNQKTALHVAVECTNPEVVAALVRMGADPNAKDSDGYSSMDYALSILQDEVEIDEELGWNEPAARKEAQRRADIFVMLGGDLNIFESGDVEDLELITLSVE